MEAVRSTADRIDLFNQAGQAVVPQKASDVLAFLEPVLHPVRAPRAGRLFHPKVWLLKFREDDDQISYQLVCMTRNLTADRSWDAVASFDGCLGTRRQPVNEPLRALIAALPALCTTPLGDDRRQRVLDLAQEIRRVTWELPEDARTTPSTHSAWARVAPSPTTRATAGSSCRRSWTPKAWRPSLRRPGTGPSSSPGRSTSTDSARQRTASRRRSSVSSPAGAPVPRIGQRHARRLRRQRRVPRRAGLRREPVRRRRVPIRRDGTGSAPGELRTAGALGRSGRGATVPPAGPPQAAGREAVDARGRASRNESRSSPPIGTCSPGLGPRSRRRAADPTW